MQINIHKLDPIRHEEILLMDLGFDRLGSSNDWNAILDEKEYAAIRDCVNVEKEWG